MDRLHQLFARSLREIEAHASELAETEPGAATIYEAGQLLAALRWWAQSLYRPDEVVGEILESFDPVTLGAVAAELRAVGSPDARAASGIIMTTVKLPTGQRLAVETRLDHRSGPTPPSQAAYIDRSGFGVRADGHEVYVAGPALSVCTLGTILADAGVVRGMELDINPNWVSGAYFTAGSAARPVGHRLYPREKVDPAHYFSSSSRDWFAWYMR